MSAPMVRALLAGTKTQTRRVVKQRDLDYMDEYQGLRERDNAARCPYGQPSDRLWVRETWGYRCSAGTAAADQYMHTIVYRADDARHNYGPMPMDGVGLPRWRERKADQDWPEWDAQMTAYWRQWRPSIFMPRWASRLTLDITEVRVQRLHEISEDDARAEGVTMPDGTPSPPDFWSYRQEYGHLWDRINGPGSWDANPWVWAISFKRIA